MAHSIFSVAGKIKTYGEFDRLQHYIEKEADPGDHPRDAALDTWRDALRDLRQGMTKENVDQWLASAHVRLEGDRLTIGVADDFTRHWLESRLDWQVRQSLDRTGHGHLQVEYQVATGPAPDSPTADRTFGREDWHAYARERLDDLGITPRQGHGSEQYNSVLGIHYVLSASPKWFEEHPEQREAWVRHSREFVERVHGAANVLGGGTHDHQSSFHLHVVVLPIDDRGRLSASSFLRTPRQLEQLHTDYNRHLRSHGLFLDRGENARLERSIAASPPAAKALALEADDIPLDEVLARLEADRDGRDPRRWFVGDRIIQVHDDNHGYTEIARQGSSEGTGAIDLMISLRQEGNSPLEQHGLAVGYLAATHPERIAGGAPPLVPHVPERQVPPPPPSRESVPFGERSRWEPGQFILVDTAADADLVAGTAKGWGKIAVAPGRDALPVDALDEAIAKGWMVDVATRNEGVWQAIQDRYPEQGDAPGRQIWRSAPSAHRAAGPDRGIEPEQTPDIGPEMMMG